MRFLIISNHEHFPEDGRDTVYLKIDNWNDFSFVTMFWVALHDNTGKFHEIGWTKIGFKGQTSETKTFTKLLKEFDSLSDEFFSLGFNTDFYGSLSSLPQNLREEILYKLRDIVFRPQIIEELQNQEVFRVALLRSVSLSVIKGQFTRVLNGQAELSDFFFNFIRHGSDSYSEIKLSFNVKTNTTPSTNIHALIGRNGVGKTTLLNCMINSITSKSCPAYYFSTLSNHHESKITEDYFSSLVSVSFSAFDSFTPPSEQTNPANGTCYFYIGLKNLSEKNCHRTISQLYDDLFGSLWNCFFYADKIHRWLKAIETLKSDINFSSNGVEELLQFFLDLRDYYAIHDQPDSIAFLNDYRDSVIEFMSKMSSGHAIVLLTLTRLVETVEEKTLVLLDEPESHLHPPLLSAFLRSISNLLYDRNGVAIVATHSPVVLQEIPSSCVWKICRVGNNLTCCRPTIETFGENVGILTSEVFSLEVERSGYHDLLAKSVENGRTYDEIIFDYNNQLGLEGKAILKALVTIRDRKKTSAETA